MAMPDPLQMMGSALLGGGSPNPNTLGDYYQAQKQQMMAEMLLKNMGRATQAPQEWNSMRLVPKMSALSALTGVASGYLGGKAYDKALQGQQKYMSDIYGGAQPSSQPTGQSTGGAMAPPADGTGQGGSQPTAGQPQAGTQDQGGDVIPGTNTTMQKALTALRFGTPGAKEVVEQGFKYYAPAQIQTEMRAAGIDPGSQLGRQIAQSALSKSLYIAPNAVRPGTVLTDASTHAVVANNPDAAAGSQNIYGDPNNPGIATSQAPIAGGIEAVAAGKGAAKAGEVSNEYTILPTSGGGSRVVGGPHTGIQGGQYFPLNGPQNAPAANPVAHPATGGAIPDAKGPWSSIPKLTVPNELGGANDFTKGVLKGAADKHTELASKYGAESDLADQQLNYYDEALKSLPNAEVGPISDWMTENRAKLSEWGVPKDMIPGSGKVTPTFTLNKNLLNAALQGAKQTYGARMTSSEVMLQKNEASPSVKTTRDAIASLIGQAKARIAYQKQRSDDYGTYIQKGGDPNRFEGWYSSKFPLTDFARKYESANPVSASPQSAPTKTVGGKNYVQRGKDWFEAD